MPVSEIRTGMTGVGKTVFEGSELQEFKVHILGVLRNVQGPNRNLILARLEGGPLAQTGVAQGMSGSPVYIDGRLIGAVSYSIGAFSKEPIAGITPIEEMRTRPRCRVPGSRARRAWSCRSLAKTLPRRSPQAMPGSPHLRPGRPTSRRSVFLRPPVRTSVP
jgi:hypothetical protein